MRSAASWANSIRSKAAERYGPCSGRNLVQPALGDRQHLREQPCLDLAIELWTVVFGTRHPGGNISPGELGQQKATSLAAILEFVERVNAALTDDRRVLGLDRQVGGQSEPRILGELGRQFLGQLVAVAEQRERDFAGDPALEGTDRVGIGPGLGLHRAGAGMNENGTP